MEDNDGSDEEIKRAKPKDISYKIFFNNYESIMILAACTICMVTLYHYETILSIRLIQEMGMSEENLGFFFCAQSITYATFSYITSQISNEKTNGYLISLGFCLTFIGNVLMGPSIYFGLP